MLNTDRLLQLTGLCLLSRPALEWVVDPFIQVVDREFIGPQPFSKSKAKATKTVVQKRISKNSEGVLEKGKAQIQTNGKHPCHNNASSRKGSMGQWNAVYSDMHRLCSWIGQYLEISFVSLRTWWRRFSNPLLDLLVCGGISLALPGDEFGPISKCGPAVVHGRIRPLFQGIGWSMAAISLMVSIYYNVIVAWTLVYLYIIVTGHSGDWASCRNSFNTIYCSSTLEDARCNDQLGATNSTHWAFYFNGTCNLGSDEIALAAQQTTYDQLPAASPAEEFFE
uniref:Uncharacterized protein n=1 Tax=Ditylenchus dipsaci TaxID=166011 RepID=A0A915D524_9BILA